MRMTPVLFELGARPHPPRDLYRAYLEQSHIFIGIYWQSYGWTAPDMDISGLEDEYDLGKPLPRLAYIKHPASEREPELEALIERMALDEGVSAKRFAGTEQLQEMIANDLAVILAEH